MRFVSLFVLGVLPALMLGVLAVIGVWAGLKTLMIQPHWLGLVLCIWGAAGVWGAVSLVRAAVGDATIKIRFGLYAGMFAIVPIMITTAFEPGLVDSPVLFLVSIAPFLVACFLIAELYYAQVRRASAR